MYIPPQSVPSARKSKYRNTKCKALGEKFDSVGERDRWYYLLEAEKQGKIRNLKRQVKFEMVVEGNHICDMIPDYGYEIKNGTEWIQVISDFKGGYKIPPDWNIKQKLLKALYGHDIYIVKISTAPLTPGEKDVCKRKNVKMR